MTPRYPGWPMKDRTTVLFSEAELAELRRRLMVNPNRYVGDPEAACLDILRLLNEVEACRSVQEAEVGLSVVFIPDPELLGP